VGPASEGGGDHLLEDFKAFPPIVVKVKPELGTKFVNFGKAQPLPLRLVQGGSELEGYTIKYGRTASVNL
jgi:hypothetical protein